METAINPVQNGRGRKRRWPAEQKLAVLQEWKNGVPLEAVCRKYRVNAAQMYRWKRSLDQGLKESGELVPKRQVLGLQKRVEELEQALGRKALEVDLFKKVYELKGLRLPEGTSGGWCGSQDVPWRSRVGCSTSPGVGSTTGGGQGVDGRCGGRTWRRRSAGSSGPAQHRMVTGGSMPCSSATDCGAIPRRCGGCCADGVGWRRGGGRGHGMDDGTRGRCGWPNPIGDGPRTSRASGPGMASGGAWPS